MDAHRSGRWAPSQAWSGIRVSGYGARMPNANDLECLEHHWQLRGVAFDPDGSLENHECTRCGAVIVTRAETS
jgi:hypothetical protein